MTISEGTLNFSIFIILKLNVLFYRCDCVVGILRSVVLHYYTCIILTLGVY